MFLLCALLVSCGSNTSGGNRGGGGGTDTSTASEFTKQEEVIEISETIGESGGIINFTSQQLGGDVIVEVPPGSFSSSQTVSVGYASGLFKVNSGDSMENALVINCSEETLFKNPLKITVKIPESFENDVPIPYYIDDEGKFHLCQIISIDRENRTFTFLTYHASIFTWVFEQLFTNNRVSTDFKPSIDGFQIDNLGSTYNPGGECFGMTSWALWWFENHSSFYGKYMFNVNPTTKGQDVIATRAHISISQKWASFYTAIVAQQQGVSDDVQFVSIRNAIKNTKNPVLIYLWQSAGNAAHSVLAIAGDDDNIDIYDPNDHGNNNSIDFDTVAKEWINYGNYDGIVYSGDGSLSLTEDFKYIKEDADNNFNSSTAAQIEITSHQTDQTIEENVITLLGNIESAEIAVNNLDIVVNRTTHYKQAISINSSTGEFSVPITLRSGENVIDFITRGDNSSGTSIPVNNNYVTKNFVINVDVPYHKFLVTLTWDQAVDLDLYVSDPTGEYSCYFSKGTSSGGFLDYDNTSGYGPEHWELLSTDVIQYNQPYEFRVHYYSGSPPTNYTVTILVDEGQPNERTHTFRGTLSTSDVDNDGVNDTGSDWANVTTISIPNLSAASFSPRSNISNILLSLDERKAIKATHK